MRALLIISFLTALGLVSSCSRSVNDAPVDDEKKELKIENRIIDSAHLLHNDQADSIFQIIKDLDDNIGSQIAIITVDTLNGVPLNKFSLDKANEMGLGRAEINDGLLIVIAVKDYSARIEVGYGLEKIIRDEIAARIIREDMIPRFRQNDYSSGLKAAVKKIKELIEANKELVGQRL